MHIIRPVATVIVTNLQDEYSSQMCSFEALEVVFPEGETLLYSQFDMKLLQDRIAFLEQKVRANGCLACQEGLCEKCDGKSILHIDLSEVFTKAMNHMSEEVDVRWPIGMALEEIYGASGIEALQKQMQEAFIKSSGADLRHPT